MVSETDINDLIPLTSTQNATYVNIDGKRHFGNISSINSLVDEKNNSDSEEKNENYHLFSVTRSERSYPQFHFRKNGNNYFMKRLHAGKKHLVLTCTDTSCGAKMRLKPAENIIQPFTGSKKQKVQLDPSLDNTFDSRFLFISKKYFKKILNLKLL